MRTIGEILAETLSEPPKRQWGGWKLSDDNETLDFEETAYWMYVKQLENPVQLIDWIFQLNGKTWVTPEVMKDFLNAVDDLVSPQATIVHGAA